MPIQLFARLQSHRWKGFIEAGNVFTSTCIPVGLVMVNEVACPSSSQYGHDGAAPGPEDALGLHKLVHRHVVYRVPQPQDCADPEHARDPNSGPSFRSGQSVTALLRNHMRNAPTLANPAPWRRFPDSPGSPFDTLVVLLCEGNVFARTRLGPLPGSTRKGDGST